MPSSLDAAPKVYGGDFREIFRNPLALFGAVIGCGVTIALMVFLAYQMSRDCILTFEKAWLEHGEHELYNEAFNDAVLAECDTLDDETCLLQIKTRWLADDMDVHTVTFNLAVTEACPAETEDEDEFEIDFEPGTLVKLGVEVEDKEIPEKIIIEETRAEEEEVPEEAVTEDEEAKPAEEKPEEDKPKDKPKEKPKKPTEKKDKKLPTSKLPTKKNNPFNDLPTTTVQKGDPFGDPGGWSDLKKDGDPWATQVMKALNNMPVGAFGAKMGKGTSKFQITLCKDGKVKKVQKKGGSLDAGDQARVANAVRSLNLPKPPKKVADKMKGSCAKIKYTFVWSSGKVK
jgi:outer membrane biosynthesis protein TonB